MTHSTDSSPKGSQQRGGGRGFGGSAAAAAAITAPMPLLLLLVEAKDSWVKASGDQLLHSRLSRKEKIGQTNTGISQTIQDKNDSILTRLWTLHVFENKGRLIPAVSHC